MNQEIMMERIAMLLSRFSESINILNANGEFSINVHAENALMKLLNVIFDCNLENINYVENKQFPSIDLRDKEKKIAIQVTADESLTKVLDCIKKFIKNGLDKEYDRLYIVMLVRKQKKYSQKSIDKVRGTYSFNSSNILEFKDLYSMLNAKNDIESTKIVLEYLESQFADPIDYDIWKKYTCDLCEYDESVVRQYEYIDITGYSPRINNLQIKVNLQDVYVNQLLKFDNKEIETFFPISHLLSKNNKTVVLGEPGTGKSTLLKWIMYDICANRNDYSVEVPIYIKCSVYAKKVMAEQMDLSAFIINVLNIKNKEVYLDAIIRENLILLLDGLDEIGDISTRHEVVANINTFIAQNPHCRVIVTSRKIGYNEARLDAHFTHLELLPFNGNQIFDFVENWYKAVDDEEFSISKVEKAVEDIRLNKSVYELAKTPLLLMIICLIQYQGTSLPENRVELYDIATGTLLENWVKKRGGNDKGYFSRRLITGILSPVAFYMQENCDDGIISEIEFRSKMMEIYANKDYTKTEIEVEEEVDSLLNYIKTEAGFISEIGVDERGIGQFGFIHLTFQEYFSAIRMAAKWQMGMTCEELKQYVLAPHWSEVMILTAEVLYMTGADPDLGCKYVSEYIENLIAIEDEYEERCRPFLLVLNILKESIVIRNVLLKRIVSMSINNRRFARIFCQIAINGMQSRQYIEEVMQWYLRYPEKGWLTEIVMGLSSHPRVEEVLIKELNEKDSSLNKELFYYNVVYPVASIVRTEAYRNSITNFVNNNKIEHIPPQYILSWVDDSDDEQEKSEQVIQAVLNIENPELRQYLAEDALTSILWKDYSDMEKYSSLLKKENIVDCSKIDKFIAHTREEDQLEEKVKDAENIIRSYNQFDIYYSKDDNIILIVMGGEIYTFNLPIISLKDINLYPVVDNEEFSKFIEMIIESVNNEKLLFDSVERFDLYVKYKKFLILDVGYDCNERDNALDFFFANMETNEYNLRKYISVFSMDMYYRPYAMCQKEDKLEFIINCNLDINEKIQILACLEINRKYRREVNRLMNEYLKSDIRIRDDGTIFSLMQRI
ncbi:MAG: SMEK domain-containing protein [Lachnospiraceae bacterium]|nr:SMEK domain-containing protein [Lachnospiraceae bacterium]